MDDREIAAREKFEATVRAAVTEFVQGQYPDRQGLYVNAWVVSVEYTSVELEQNGQGGIHCVAPMSQAMSTSRGLTEFASERWSSR